MRRFFFLQVRALRRDHRPQYAVLASVEAAWAKAGGDQFAERYGAYAELRRAARCFDDLCAIYGRKRDITEFSAGAVLKELSAQTDDQRLQDLASHHMSKQRR
jgi:hypothetical protein